MTVIDGTMPRCDAYGPQGSLNRLKIVAQRCEYKSPREAVVLDDRSPGLLIDASVGLPGDAWQRYVDMAKVVEPLSAETNASVIAVLRSGTELAVGMVPRLDSNGLLSN